MKGIGMQVVGTPMSRADARDAAAQLGRRGFDAVRVALADVFLAAAGLKARNDLEEAPQLLADKEYLALLPAPPATTPGRNTVPGDGATRADGVTPDVGARLMQLHDEAAAARNCVPAVLEWLVAEPINTCSGQTSQQQSLVAKLADKLMPAYRKGPFW